MLKWVDWAEAVLRPATYLGGDALVAAEVELEAALTAGELNAAAAGLAEVCCGGRGAGGKGGGGWWLVWW